MAGVLQNRGEGHDFGAAHSRRADAVGLLVSGASAELPVRPVKLIVPYAPGGPNDIMARLLAQKFSETLSGTFFVDNLPGGGRYDRHGDCGKCNA